MSDDRLIVGLDLPNAIEALQLTKTLGDSVGFYKIGLGMLTGGGLALGRARTGDAGSVRCGEAVLQARLGRIASFQPRHEHAGDDGQLGCLLLFSAGRPRA